MLTDFQEAFRIEVEIFFKRISCGIAKDPGLSQSIIRGVVTMAVDPEVRTGLPEFQNIIIESIEKSPDYRRVRVSGVIRKNRWGMMGHNNCFSGKRL